MVGEWLMKGTNDGDFMGLPPTGRSIAVPDVDVIEVGADGITSVRGYFTNSAMMEQLDMQVSVQPKRIGPVSFGTSTYISIGDSAWTNLWTDGQMNMRLLRCTECGVMAAVTSANECKCSTTLPEPAPNL